MKVKECECYRNAMNAFLEKRMLSLKNDIESEVKKVLGLNFLGMITDYLSNTRITDIFRNKLGRIISTFILLKKPVIEKKNDLNILHIEGCTKLDRVKTEQIIYPDYEEEGFNIPID
ncbi:MAG: hypothetical protein ACTSO9_16070 [Candidatus Helarchaeota archaeon]